MVKKALVLGLILSVVVAQFNIDVVWSEMPETAANIYCAQTRLNIPNRLRRITPPEPIRINGLEIPEDITDPDCRTNKKNKYGPQNLKGPCPKGYCSKKILAGTLDPARTECDEYPPASFLEGGGWDKSGRQAAQRCVTKEESKAQSGLFQRNFKRIDNQEAYPYVTITVTGVPDGVDCNALINDEQIHLSSLVDVPMPERRPRPE